MFDPNLSDSQLIKEVKSNNDSKALEELIHRHTGIYCEIVNRYNYMPQLEKNELINDKIYNIYQYILKYNESKNTKLSTYIGECVKYECMDILTNRIEKEEIDDNLAEVTNIEIDKEYINLLVKEAKVIDKRFYRIVEMRYLTNSPSTLKEIGIELGVTKERVRQIFEEGLKVLRKRIKGKAGNGTLE